MAVKVTRKGSLTTSIDLTNLENLVKGLKEISQGDLLKRAAEILQRKAFDAMKKQYFNTQSDRIYDYRAKKARKGFESLEDALFADVPAPVFKGNKQVEFQFWAGYGALSKRFPYLRAQEEGAKDTIDEQPFEVTKRKPGNKGRPRILANITKAEASGKPIYTGPGSVRDTRGRFSKIEGSIMILDVPHPALKARKFIAAGNFLIKTQGERIVRDFINSELQRYINA